MFIYSMNYQAPNSVVMVRPHHFTPNPQTADDNAYQITEDKALDSQILKTTAYKEVTQMAVRLRELGVNVHLFEDKSISTPDSVFPNNWFSAHADGSVYLYPMYAPNRRLERRQDIIEQLQHHYVVNKVVDLSGWEEQQQYLEGTGVLVIDHQAHLAYVAASKRADIKPLKDFCSQQQLTPLLFNARDSNGVDVYHTNVLMCVSTDFVIIGDEMIQDEAQREILKTAIRRSGKLLVSLTEQQVKSFAGNMFELTGKNGRFIAMSETAFSALTIEQKQLLHSKVAVEAFNIPTIELAGGSVRCMLAGIHLAKQKVRLAS